MYKNSVKTGTVAYNRKGLFYVFLGHITVPIAYGSDKTLAEAKPQTVEVWFSHTHFPTCIINGNGRLIIPTNIKENIQRWITDYKVSHNWDTCFIISSKPNLIHINFDVVVNENGIVDLYKDLFKNVSFNSYDKEKARAKYYLCNGTWSRRKFITEILDNL